MCVQPHISCPCFKQLAECLKQGHGEPHSIQSPFLWKNMFWNVFLSSTKTTFEKNKDLEDISKLICSSLPPASPSPCLLSKYRCSSLESTHVLQPGTLDGWDLGAAPMFDDSTSYQINHFCLMLWFCGSHSGRGQWVYNSGWPLLHSGTAGSQMFSFPSVSHP